jgi:O-antigen/teichoic acid export membrane protein
MVGAVPSRELGLYTVAVTLSTASSFVTGAVGPPLGSRIARGDVHLTARALRTVLAIAVVVNVSIAAVTPVVLPLLFGQAFHSAVAMALVLFAASLPLAGTTVLSTALIADGHPGLPSWGEAIALVVTAGGLVLLLGPLGGLGAALVSLAAYSANFAFQLAAMLRLHGGSLREHLVVQRSDLHWIAERLRRR